MKKLAIFIFMMILLCNNALGYMDEGDYLWAVPAINRWKSRGIITGYTDGTFRGNNNITRAELTVIANRINNSIEENSKRVAVDVLEGDYFFDDVCTAVNKGLIKIDSSKKLRPREYATREDAMVVFANLFKLSYGENSYEYLIKKFPDGQDVTYENMKQVAGFIEAGFISGYEDGTLRPKNRITRAELISMLDKSIADICDEGIYYNEVINGSIVINGRNVKIKNCEISGKIFVLDGVGEGLPEIINTNIGQGIISRVGDIKIVKDSKFETATEYRQHENSVEPALGYVKYNKTDWTNSSVKATLKLLGNEYKVVNNNGKDYYRFENNGEFIFECENDGDIKQFKAQVNNIDKVIPVIEANISMVSEVPNVTVTVSDDTLSPIDKVAYMKGDVSKEVAIGGTIIGGGVFTVNERGKYTIAARDLAGNIGRKVISTEDIIYMVTFNSNGGSGSMESQSIIKEVSAPLTSNTFTHSGGIFKGWSTEVNGEVSYTDMESVSLTDNITLYAVWELDKFKIEVQQKENGTISPETLDVAYGSNQTFTITPNENYKIDKLLIDGVEVEPSATYTFENVTAPHIISAEYVENTASI